MDDVQDAITQAATEAGIDPAFALAVAQRESDFNPTAHSSKTIFGIFQMSGDLRRQYGVGNSSDPYIQARGWTAFIGDQKAQMEKALGRPVSDSELYFAHHFGTERAIHMIGGNPNTNVADVFTPYEMQINPHFGRAGTTGNLMSSITGDITRREAAFGGQAAPWGAQTAENLSPNPPLTYKSTEQPIDPASFGSPLLAETTSEGAAQSGEGLSQIPQQVLAAAEKSFTQGAQQQPASTPPVPSAEPVYGMSPPQAQAYMNNPGIQAMRMAQMRGGRAGQEIDISQFGIKPGANLKNPALSNAAPANPALGGAVPQNPAVAATATT